MQKHNMDRKSIYPLFLAIAVMDVFLCLALPGKDLMDGLYMGGISLAIVIPLFELLKAKKDQASKESGHLAA